MAKQFQFTVACTHPALPGHFPARPIVPGVLLLDHVLCGVASESGRQVERLQQVKFVAALLPNETARVQLDARAEQVLFSVDVQRGDSTVRLATGALVLAPATTPQGGTP